MTATAQKPDPAGHDPLGCQAHPQLSYVEFSEDCERRAKLGQVQTHCATCDRYRWRRDRCKGFVAATPQPAYEEQAR